MLVFCTPSHEPAHIVLTPHPVASSLPAPAQKPAATSLTPFERRSDRPEEALRDYALAKWGAGGGNIFSGGRLQMVGQYAVVGVTGETFYYLRDFGEHGWVTHLEPLALTSPNDVVVKYTVKDDGEAADWKKWQTSHTRTPEVRSVTHMVVEIWSLADTNHPRAIFAHEYEAWANCCGSEIGPAPPRVSDEVRIALPRIEIAVREAWRATRQSFLETPLPNIPAVLAPWDTVKARVFTWDGHEFTEQ